MPKPKPKADWSLTDSNGHKHQWLRRKGHWIIPTGDFGMIHGLEWNKWRSVRKNMNVFDAPTTWPNRCRVKPESLPQVMETVKSDHRRSRVANQAVCRLNRVRLVIRDGAYIKTRRCPESAAYNQLIP